MSAALDRLRALFSARRPAADTGAPVVSRRDLAGLAGAGGAALLSGGAGAVPPGGFAAMDRPALEVLVRGLAEMGRVGDGDLTQRSAGLLGEIAAVMPEAPHLFDLHAMFRPEEDGYVHRRPVVIDLGVVQRACHQATPLRIGYTDLKGQHTLRDVWPLALVYPDHGIFVLAWCCVRQDYRQFFAHAIDRVEPVAGGFTDRRMALLAGLVDHHRARQGPRYDC
ncbi:MAG: WYL domain-containing protein [Paracoccaceae bacterium]